MRTNQRVVSMGNLGRVNFTILDENSRTDSPIEASEPGSVTFWQNVGKGGNVSLSGSKSVPANLLVAVGAHNLTERTSLNFSN